MSIISSKGLTLCVHFMYLTPNAQFQLPAIMSPSPLLLLCLACLSGGVMADLALPRGVSMAKASLYPAGDTFTCLDGSATIQFHYVNDDYCDCEDGSDEPGTSACATGTFYCPNRGHAAAEVPSAWVNDGVCGGWIRRDEQGMVRGL